MGETTGIEWTDRTFNPWTGCTKVSAACDHCYAEGWAKRYGHVTWGPHGERRRTMTWRDPVKWNAQAARDGRRVRVFCASLSDVFDNHRSILPEWRHDLWALIEDTTNLDWQLLTKRPQNAARFAPDRWRDGWPPNIWLGTTVENQVEADRRIPVLLRIPARVHFLSMEPLLGPVDLTQINGPFDALRGVFTDDPEGEFGDTGQRLDWVITGGESGPGARPTHPDWVRSLRDQCQAAGVPFLFKQWGEWAPGASRQRHEQLTPGVLYEATTVFGDPAWIAAQDAPWSHLLERFGKKRTGRLLDGTEWTEFPKEIR